VSNTDAILEGLGYMLVFVAESAIVVRNSCGM